MFQVVPSWLRFIVDIEGFQVPLPSENGATNKVYTREGGGCLTPLVWPGAVQQHDHVRDDGPHARDGTLSHIMHYVNSFRKSTPTQIRQLTLRVSNSKR